MFNNEKYNYMNYYIYKKIILIIIDMCGIFAYLGSDDSASITFNGLKILLNRGYDSCGICSIIKVIGVNKKEQWEFVNTKFASVKENECINQLSLYIKKHASSNISIGHTRWATHGAKTDINSHPHFDYLDTLSLVHNGIIENYLELKQMLIENNFEFRSETDTEVIANLISYYLTQNLDIYDAINKCQETLKGTWGVVLIFKCQPNKIYCFRNGSPINIGLSNISDSLFIASESRAFSGYCNKYLSLKNKELYVFERDIEKNRILKIDLINKQPLSINFDNFCKILTNKIYFSPEPYNHWIIKEIYEQTISIENATNNGGRLLQNTTRLGGLDEIKDSLLEIDDLIIIGCGSSFNAGNIGKKYFQYLNCFNHVDVIDSSELDKTDFSCKFKTGLLSLSQSGETRDSILAINKYGSLCHKVLSIVNVVGSVLSEISDAGVYLNSGIEMSVAATKSFTSQCLVLLLVSIWFSYYKKSIIDHSNVIQHIKNLPLNIKYILDKYDNISSIASKIIDNNNLFILSGGISKAIADEGALKIKEISYINCQAYQVSALKHGPFALIDSKTFIIFIASKLDSDIYKKTLITSHETKTRGSTNILITDADESIASFDYVIQIPETSLLTFPILSIIPLQIIAYKLSIMNDINPDFPRNLAKSVTVD